MNSFSSGYFTLRYLNRCHVRVAPVPRTMSSAVAKYAHEQGHASDRKRRLARRRPADANGSSKIALIFIVIYPTRRENGVLPVAGMSECNKPIR
jgi:hypothetical protein